MTLDPMPQPRNRAERRAQARRKAGAVLAASGAAFSTTALVLGAAAAPAGADAVETVNTTADTGGGSLREAIADVDPGGQVVFDLPAGSTIQLDTQIVIDKNITITGPGAADLTVEQTGAGERIFDVNDGTGTILDVTISGLTFTGGDASGDGGAIHVDGEDITVTDSVFTANTAASDGGAIGVRDSKGTVTIERSTFTGNVAVDDEGGAIQLDGVYGAVLITDSTISGNSADDAGGGIYAEQTDGDTSLPNTITITNTTITGNTAGAGGGGVMLDDVYGLITIDGSTISGNSAQDWRGGGVYLEDVWGGVSITNSQITGNTTAEDGGGVAIYRAYGPLDFVGNTISGNHSSDDGGGVWVAGLFDHDGEDDATLLVSTSTVSGNTAGGVGGGLAFMAYGENWNYADILVLDSTLSANTADAGGGGMWVSYNYGHTAVVQSTISGNVANGGEGGYEGGAISFRTAENPDYDLTIIQSTITGNAAPNVGGVYLPEQEIVKSTEGGGKPADDSAADDGVASERERTRGVHTKFTANNRGQATIVGTILAGNSGDDLGVDGDVTAQSSIFTTISSGITFTDAGGNQLNVANLLLGPLQDNGGPTETHELLPGSPAIDTGSVPPPVYPTDEFDQRGAGFLRVVAGAIDVGAFEVQPPPALEPNFTG